MRTIDPFVGLAKPLRMQANAPVPAVSETPAGRAHSKFPPSGADRWMNCPGSVELSEGMPDKPTVWSEEGVRAHKMLEKILLAKLQGINLPYSGGPSMMYLHGESAAKFIIKVHQASPRSSVLVETRIYLKFIHEEMFGTFDGAVVDHFGTLHVFDYKYGAGHFVSPDKNLQMITYGMGLAEKYRWNFKRIRLWIIQPRVRGYDGPLFWEVSTKELRAYIPLFRKAVRRVEREPDTYVEGPWCWWCKGKSKCPLKLAAKADAAKSVFAIRPLEG